MTKRSEDLTDGLFGAGPSAYSMHPNWDGAQAYADEMNKIIKGLEDKKNEVKTITGVITIADADTDMTNNVPLENAEIKIQISSDVSFTTLSNSLGEYALADIPRGTYTLTVTKDGYIPLTEVVSFAEGSSNVIHNIMIEAIPDEFEGIGYAEGSIFDVETGSTVSGMTLYIRKGLENTTGNVVGSLYMNDSTTYSIAAGLPAGNYTIQVIDERTDISEEERYISSSFNIKVLGGITIDNQNGYVSHSIATDDLRIVLTWGASPSDLDSHFNSYVDGARDHIYYSNMIGSSGNLDVDDTTSYGPETITVTDFSSLDKGFKYSIHDYSNRSSSNSTILSQSGATVKVYFRGTLMRVFHVPANRGGTVWNVFRIDSSGRITELNTFEYESDPSNVGSSLVATGNDTNSNRVELGPTSGSNRTLSVNASAEDESELTYTWYFYNSVEDTTVEMDYDADTTEIEVSALWEGEYRCLVTDQYGNTNTVTFFVSTDNHLMATCNDTEESEVYLDPTEGSTKTMKVNVTADDESELTYIWYFYDNASGETEELDNDADTTEIEVRAVVEGQYWCEVSDQYGNSATATFYISTDNHLAVTCNDTEDNWVQLDPEVGSTKTMKVNVAADDESELTYTWYFYSSADGETEELDYAAGTTEIKVRAVVEGAYWCEVSDQYGNSATATFYISTDNHLTATCNDTEDNWVQLDPEVGSTKAMKVNVTADDESELTYTWYFYSSADGETEELDYAAGTTEIEVSAVVEGEYWCEVEDQYGNKAWVTFAIYADI